MIPLPLDQLRRLGRLEGNAETVTGVEIDSRRVGPGDLFVALGGGVAFLEDARTRGAAATLLPDDEFAAMAELGRAVRERSEARVVAITGSSGKTSTKDILAALCRPVARTIAAEEGHNNEIGLPLTMTRLEPDTEVLIAEMGMRGLGEIAALCEVARPEIGVITNIGPVHLERLGTIERVAQAKAELLQALPTGGIGVIPEHSPELEPFVPDGLSRRPTSRSATARRSSALPIARSRSPSPRGIRPPTRLLRSPSSMRSACRCPTRSSRFRSRAGGARSRSCLVAGC
jgi:UDP-N-acetylmuramoyl-tripeptide--D-alanyl-D-alanine ligase